jgi:TonB-dependent SusC/RagA subfamily outer membrane receptor
MRGPASIESAASPLYIVDGVIVSNETVNSGLNAVTVAGPVPFAQDPEDNTPNGISDLNAADIARIEVLKGPVATAIYGSKAAAGAIVVTTNTGRPGPAQWSLTGRGGTFLSANSLPLRKFPTYASANAWWHNDLKQPADLPRQFYAGPQDYQHQLLSGGQASGEGDLRVRGGSSLASYYGSLTDMYDNGVMRETGYGKQAARFTVSGTLPSKATGTISLYQQHSRTVRGVSGNDNDGIAPYDVFATTPQFVPLTRRPVPVRSIRVREPLCRCGAAFHAHDC